MAKKKQKRSRKKSITLGPIIGGVMSAYQMYKMHGELTAQGMDSGNAAVLATTGYNPTTKTFDMGTAGRAWGPAAVGYVAHEVAGNAKGAFRSGIGLKLNRYLPPGINI